MTGLKEWCGREDSNFHGLSPTATSTLRVYRFRHDRPYPCVCMVPCIGKVSYRFNRRGISNHCPVIKHPLFNSAIFEPAARTRGAKTAANTESSMSLSPPPSNESHERPPAAGITIRATIRAAGRIGGLQWLESVDPVDYPDAVAFMEHRVDAIRAGREAEAVWLLEHPALYTAGTSARPEELLDAAALPVYSTGRGGRYTYHGPGQRVAYVMLDLRRRGSDVRAYVHDLEGWVIDALARLGVTGERRCDRVGIWVERGGGREAKIAAIGVRVRRWITFHGIAINIDPDLSHFGGIVPCGIAEHGVTSLADLGIDATLADVDAALRATVPPRFENADREALPPESAAVPAENTKESN